MDSDFTILLAEDDKDDVFFVKSALAAAKIFNFPLKIREHDREEKPVNICRAGASLTTDDCFPCPKSPSWTLRCRNRQDWEVH